MGQRMGGASPCPSPDQTRKWPRPSWLSFYFLSVFPRPAPPRWHHCGTPGSTCERYRQQLPSHECSHIPVLCLPPSPRVADSVTVQRGRAGEAGQATDSQWCVCVPDTPESCSPLLLGRDAGEGRGQTVEVEGHVALVAHELLVGVLLAPAQVAGTGAAQLAGVVLALFAGWSALSWTQRTGSAGLGPLGDGSLQGGWVNRKSSPQGGAEPIGRMGQ